MSFPHFLFRGLLCLLLCSFLALGNANVFAEDDDSSGDRGSAPCEGATGPPRKGEVCPEDIKKAAAGNIPLSYTIHEAHLGKSGFDINPSGWTGVVDFSERFLQLLTGIVVLLSIAVFMLGGGMWIFSAGNESLVGRGKDMMLYSCIGLFCVLGAYVIVRIAQIVLYALGT